MAILVIRIEDPSTFLMNEFFDYDGWCYGLTRSRLQNTDRCINLEDFYEGTVRSECLDSVPVVFVQEREDSFYVAGWYREAKVRRDIMRPSLFLEGNVRAASKDVWLLPEDGRVQRFDGRFGSKCYEVVEEDDSRYQQLAGLVAFTGGQNAFLRYDYVDIFPDSRLTRDYDSCVAHCTELAAALMEDACRDIREIKELEIYAKRAVILQSRKADGYYYQAMASCQLGRTKNGLKAIEKALKLEPEAADLQAMKGHLLVGAGHIEAAAEWFHRAWLTDGDEAYLLLEGRSWLFKGQMDKALACFKKIANRQLLQDAGINLKDMERRWPFINVRGFHLKKLFGRA